MSVRSRRRGLPDGTEPLLNNIPSPTHTARGERDIDRETRSRLGTDKIRERCFLIFVLPIAIIQHSIDHLSFVNSWDISHASSVPSDGEFSSIFKS
jgi:hypothetical protein